MTTTIEKFEVRNCWTHAVQFTAEISVAPDMRTSVKLGLAVRWGKANGADLSGADLSGADLRDAVLRGADLSGAVLRDAVLSGADLRSFKADFWMILTMARHEVPALVKALRDGKVDGSTYTGECACLVGTLENAGAVNLPHSVSSPAEQWFAMIRKGDKPGDDTSGGFAAAKALEWATEYCDLTGIALPVEA
jgi:uncharacterized protein YjbI with pentapeptide repeats